MHGALRTNGRTVRTVGIAKNKLSWLFVGALLALCGFLGALQYHWIGEVTVAARDRLRGTLRASLIRTSQDFNSELVTACSAILPSATSSDAAALQHQMAAQYLEWKKSARHAQMFRRVALAVPLAHSVQLQMLDLESGAFRVSAWPPDWAGILKHEESALTWMGGGPPPGDSGAQPGPEGTAFDFAVFAARPQVPSLSFRRPQVAWAIFDLNPEYAREAMLPEILQRHLGTGGSLDYQVEVVTRASPSAVIYRSDSNQAHTCRQCRRVR